MFNPSNSPVSSEPEVGLIKPNSGAIVIRRYTEEDISNLVLYIGAHLASSPNYAHMGYSKFKMAKFLQNNLTNSFMFCNLATQDGNILAGLCAKANQFLFSEEVIVEDLLLYHRPEYRAVRCIDGLIKSFVEWAKDRYPKRIFLRQTTNLNNDAFARLVGRHGFREVGRMYAIDL